MKFLIERFLLKPIEKIQVSLKWGKIIGTSHEYLRVLINALVSSITIVAVESNRQEQGSITTDSNRY